MTYREDGDKNASSAKHTVANGISVFGRVRDGLIVAVKPSTVRLNSAGFDHQERQAGWGEEAVSGTEGSGGGGVEEERDGGARLMPRTWKRPRLQVGSGERACRDRPGSTQWLLLAVTGSGGSPAAANARADSGFTSQTLFSVCFSN